MMSFLMNIKKKNIFIDKHLRCRFMMNVIIYCSKIEKINLKFYQYSIIKLQIIIAIRHFKNNTFVKIWDYYVLFL